MADELIVTVPELSLWAYQDSTRIAVNDPWANDVLVKAANLVRAIGGHDDWIDSFTTPQIARIICLRLARRTYVNVDQVVSEGAIGPVGGDTVAAAAAIGMELSDQERADLETFAEQSSDTSGFWLQPIGNGTRVVDMTVYLNDDGQINLGDTEPWSIPYGRGNDFGAFGDA